MRKTKIFTFMLIAVGFFIYFTSIGNCAVTGDGEQPKTTPIADNAQYVVPEDMTTQWENIQLQVEKVKDVCVEHCGNNTRCKEKCSKARDNNLKREYNKLMSQ